MTKTENLNAVEIALMMIMKMDDHDTWENQVDCIGHLRRLRDRIKEQIKEVPTNDN